MTTKEELEIKLAELKQLHKEHVHLVKTKKKGKRKNK
jgi:hypothetical protein